MPLFDHIGLSVEDVDRAIAEFDPVMTALGCEREEAAGSGSWWDDENVGIILYPARDEGSGPHVHGRVGWQHLAFRVDSRAEVDRLHDVAVAAGWTAVRAPKEYPRFTDRYYAAFLESSDGIRIEFMHNPPRPAADA
ncbi:MAG: VOC family protein [Microbacteriaceae bacterium]|nr:VOC family protein [Microbacteriaceae bacterium]